MHEMHAPQYHNALDVSEGSAKTVEVPIGRPTSTAMHFDTKPLEKT